MSAPTPNDNQPAQSSAGNVTVTQEQYQEYLAMRRLMEEVAGPVAQQTGAAPQHVMETALRQQGGGHPALDEKQMCLESFLEMLNYLLENIAFVFPECEKTKSAQDDFRMARHSKFAQVRIIEAWHKTMKPYYQTVIDRDDATLRTANIDWFEKLDIFTKWDDAGFSQESKDNMWSCLESLNRMSGMYNSLHSIPPGVMGNIHNVAFDVLNSLQQGGAALDELDIFDLGQRVVDSSNQQELNAFISAMPQISQNFGGFENLMKMVQNGMGEFTQDFTHGQRPQ